LDERSRYFKYVEKKRGRAVSGWMTLAERLFAVLLLVVVTELILVRYCYSWLGATQGISEYMWETLVWDFSNDAFWSLCLTNGLPEHNIYLMLLIYYSYFAATFMLFFVFVWIMIKSARRIIRVLTIDTAETSIATFHDVMCIHKLLINQFHEPRKKVRREAIGLVKSLDLYTTISPLRENWQKKAAFRWFKQNSLSKETIRVLAALKTFRRKALYCLRNDHSLLQLADGVNELATFLYFIAVREETSYRPAQPIPTLEEAVTHLVKFAEALNQIQIQREPKPALFGRMRDAVRVLCASEEVRLTTLIAIAAALVAGAGCMFFRIPVTTAFLAWFSVVFGSISISLGVTTVVLRRAK
jgi:hypothetical protein